LGEFDPGIAPHDPNLYSYDEEYHVEANGWEDVEKRMDELVQLYEDNGCVIVRNAFDPEVVSSMIDAINNIIDGKNESFSKAIEDTKLDMKDNRYNKNVGKFNLSIVMEDAGIQFSNLNLRLRMCLIS
jgi:hypothetical protein